jgi:hypothetical protein
MGEFMHSRTQTFAALMLTTLTTLGGALTAQAADTPTATTNATQSNPAMFDRDGKRICGFELMTESELAGHRSQLHMTKTIEDRDAIRVEQCKAMRKRAQERGVELKE